MTFEELKNCYLEDIELKEEMIDKQAISLPKIMAKYQFYYNDVLTEIAEVHDLLDKQYSEAFISYKKGLGDIAVFTFNSTELKKMLECSIVHRESKLRLNKLEANLKTVEEMMSNVKSIGYSINNYLTYKKIITGVY